VVPIDFAGSIFASVTVRDELFELIRAYPCIKLDDVYLLCAPALYPRPAHWASCVCDHCRKLNSHESAIRRDLLKLERAKAIHSDYVRIAVHSRYPHHNKVMWVGYPGRSRNTLNHDSDVTSFHVRLCRACAEHGLDNPQWRYGTQRNAVTRDVNPDGIFVISRPDSDYLHPFFYEEERKRGHYLRGNPQILAKVKRYNAYRQSGRMIDDFGFNDARLAIRCTTDETMGNLLRDLARIAPLRWIWISSIPRTKADLMGAAWYAPPDYHERTYSLLEIA
jgi:hypothetical protein